jgi:hypothetical protein
MRYELSDDEWTAIRPDKIIAAANRGIKCWIQSTR